MPRLPARRVGRAGVRGVRARHAVPLRAWRSVLGDGARIGVADDAEADVEDLRHRVSRVRASETDISRPDPIVRASQEDIAVAVDVDLQMFAGVFEPGGCVTTYDHPDRCMPRAFTCKLAQIGDQLG